MKRIFDFKFNSFAVAANLNHKKYIFNINKSLHRSAVTVMLSGIAIISNNNQINPVRQCSSFQAARPALRCSPSLTYRRVALSQTYAAAGSAPLPPPDAVPPPAEEVAKDDTASSSSSPSEEGVLGWWKVQQAKSAALRKRLVALGPAAVLAYGLFDGISYTIAFSIAFLGYEAKTGLNPTANVADIVKICILMWAGNNVTRPFRLAGAAALAPFMDKLMDTMKERLSLPSKFVAFLMLTASVAVVCFSILGALFFSRWVQG